MILLITLSLLSTPLAGQPVPEPYTVSHINNTGILLEEMGDLLIYHNTWSILTELDLGELEAQIALAEHAENLVYGVCLDQDTIETLCGMQQRQVHAMLENIRFRTHTIREMISSSRSKRSLFDGIGGAMHYLFGTMDSSNEREIYSKLGTLQSDQKALIELEKQQISVVKTALQKIQKPLAVLQDRQQQIAYQINDLKNSTDELTQRQTRQEILSSLLLQIIEIEFRQQNLLNIIITSKNNHLHPLLISPETILMVYNKTNSLCPTPCWSILNQLVTIQSHLIQEKLVFKLVLPIFENHPMKLQQIHCSPIQQDTQHSVIPDVKYSYLASRTITQEFLLLRENDLQQYKKVTHKTSINLFVGQPKVPIIKASASNECLIKIVFNPLNEKFDCPLKALIPPRNVFIKMYRRNSWLYSLVSPTKVQITCSQQDMITKLSNSGILTINTPCQVQIGAQILKYEGHSPNYLKLTQPSYFQSLASPYTKINLSRILPSSVHREKFSNPNLVLTKESNNFLQTESHSLEEIQARLSKVEENPSSNNPHPLAAVSMSLTAVIVIGLAAYITVKVIRLIPRKKGPNSNPQLRTSTGETPVQEEGDIPLEEMTSRGSKPLCRSHTLPRQRSLQVV